MSEEFYSLLKIGHKGENLVIDYCENYKGYQVQSNQLKACKYDITIIKPNNEIILGDIKSKARRNKYADTGIDIKHYNTYKDLMKKNGLDFQLFFVDEALGCCYGESLRVLDKQCYIGNREYPYKPSYYGMGDEIVYYPLSSMDYYFSLTTEQIEGLAVGRGRAKEPNIVGERFTINQFKNRR